MSDQNNTDPQMIVSHDATPDMLAIIEDMKNDEVKSEGIVFEEPPKENQVGDVDINLYDTQEQDVDKGASEQSADDQQTDVETTTVSEPVADETLAAFDQFLQDQKVEDKDALYDKLFQGRDFTVKQGGKDKKMSYGEIKSVLARDAAFQKKYNALERSDEYKFGILMKAAQGGNKEAQAALKQKLVEFTGSEDADAMLDSLEDVKGEFDTDAEASKRIEANAEDDAFADVKEDVDYQKNVDIIQNDMKGFMPPKVWKTFWDDPKDRRAMYNLAATGKIQEIADVFQSHLAELPLEKQLEIESDPDLYGQAFITVTNRVVKAANGGAGNGDSNGEQETVKTPTISTGSKGKNTGTGKPSAPDFLNMSDEDFRKWQKEHGLL